MMRILESVNPENEAEEPMEAPELSLRTLRKQARRSQKECAELLGVSIDTWRRWEKNPDAMPYAAHRQVFDFLERAVQIRKEINMAKNYGKVPVVAETDIDLDEEMNDYTVPIPEGLTPTFEPSKPVTAEQMNKFISHGKEAYPGMADEFAAWEAAWDQVNLAQMKADGAPINIQEVVHVDPEFDEYGEPIEYAHDPKVAVRDNGTIDVYDPDDIIPGDKEDKQD